jgi:amino acid adenylation domain-containing protein
MLGCHIPPDRAGGAESSVEWRRFELARDGDDDWVGRVVLAAATVLACSGGQTRIDLVVAEDGRRRNLAAELAANPPLRVALRDVEAALGPLARASSVRIAPVGALTFEWRIGDDALLGYDASRFRAETAERLIERFLRVVRAFALEPDRGVLDVELASDAERAAVARWGRGAERELPEATVVDAILRQADETPSRPALALGDRVLTYADVDRITAATSARLEAAGIGAGDVVAIALARGIDLPLAILGTLRSHATYLPLDPDSPPRRNAEMTEQARAVGTIGAAGDGSGALDLGLPDRSVLELQGAPRERPRPDPADADPYVIFTSGSSGRPKGVVVGQRALLNRLMWMQHRFRLDPDDVVLQKTPATFDVSVWELLWPFMAGARLEVAPPGAHRDPDELARVIAAAGVTTLHFVPSMLEVFLSRAKRADLATVRRIVCSGEALSRTAVAALAELVPAEAEIWNLYGPTEAAIDVTAWDCREEIDCATIPIGRPIDNVEILVVDASLRPAPIGVPGEILIGGVQVARGYAGDPARTAESFVSDPRGRWYKTGDFGRWLPEGVIEFLGRIDGQVKLRGQRVELGEVEAALTSHPAIVRAGAVVRELGPGDARLVAYCAAGRAEPSARDLRLFLAERLPTALIPSRFVFVDDVPTTASGKIDRRRLREAPL